MGVTYFKRYRMELDLGRPLFPAPPLPPGFELAPWRESLLEAHAAAKYASFCQEMDANVFPCLGDREGCLRLMGEIARRAGFVPEATWLLVRRRTDGREDDYCGTVQGLRDPQGYGAIQNLGVAPPWRGRGLGTILLRRALEGFLAAGLRRARLEVTAKNTGAVRLYERLGFRKTKIVYKAAETAYV